MPCRAWPVITDEDLQRIETRYTTDETVKILIAELRRQRGVIRMIAHTKTRNAAELSVIEVAKAALEPYSAAASRPILNDHSQNAE